MQQPYTPNPINPPHQGSAGEIFGTQSIATWAAGDTAGAPFQILDTVRAESLWLVVVTGPVLIDLNWGTKATRTLRGIRAPARFTIPGQFNLQVRPLVLPVPAGGVEAIASLTPVYGCCRADMRIFIDTAGPLPDDAAEFVALAPSVVTIGALPVAVPTLGRVALIAGSVLTSGAGYLEFQP